MARDRSHAVMKRRPPLAELDTGVGLDHGEVAGKGSGNKYMSFFFFFNVSKNSALVQATRRKIP